MNNYDLATAEQVLLFMKMTMCPEAEARAIQADMASGSMTLRRPSLDAAGLGLGAGAKKKSTSTVGTKSSGGGPQRRKSNAARLTIHKKSTLTPREKMLNEFEKAKKSQQIHNSAKLAQMNKAAESRGLIRKNSKDHASKNSRHCAG